MFSTVLALILIAGSYGSPEEHTIHTYSFNEVDGSIVAIDSLKGISNPSFLAMADDGKTLLAVNENDDSTAALSMLHRESPGHYRMVSSQLTSGASPCHVAISPDGRYAVTANYTGGSISVIPFDGEKGTFDIPAVYHFEGKGKDPVRQATSHPHFTTFTPDGRMMIVDDLGTDRVNTYMIGEDGLPIMSSLRYEKMPDGAGPRHMDFSSDGVNAYMINEIDGHVIHFRYDPLMGAMTPISKTFADYEHGEGSADIHLSPDGRFLYVSNRLKGDGIAIFAVNSADGSLTPAGFTPTGIHPRNFVITPDGGWLLVACRDSNSIEVYRRNSSDGSLTAANDPVYCPRPVCLIFE